MYTVESSKFSGLNACKIFLTTHQFIFLLDNKDAIGLCSLFTHLFCFYQKNMTRKQRRKLEAEREDAEDADEGPDSEADEEVRPLGNLI